MNENQQVQVDENDPLIASGELVMGDNDNEVEVGEDSTPNEDKGAEGSASDSDELTEFKAKYEEAKAQYEDLAQYEGIIEKLKTDGDLIDVLQGYLEGKISKEILNETPEDDDDDYSMWDDEGTDTDKPQPHTSGKKEPTKEDIERARAEGAAQAVVKKEVEDTLRYMMENGVPEDVQHEFVEFFMNPTGVTGRDILSVFMAKREQAGKPVVFKESSNKQASGTIAAMPGESDKPNPDRFNDGGSNGINYISDPNNI